MRPGFLSVVLLLLLAAGCATLPPAERVRPEPDFLPVAPEDLVAVGSVHVDPQNRCVVAAGWVNQVEGLVELLACGPEGKTHESVLVLDIDPIDLNAALLLLGLRPGAPPQSVGVGEPAGELVEVWVAWDAGEHATLVRGETLIRNRETDRALPRTSWVYTGLVGKDGRLKAGVDQSLVATFWDPWALLNLPLPCGANDEILLAHATVLPPLGTPVTVRLRPIPKP